MAQLLRAHATVAGDPSLVPRTHIRKFTTTCNFSFREPNASLASASIHTHVHM